MEYLIIISQGFLTLLTVFVSLLHTLAVLGGCSPSTQFSNNLSMSKAVGVGEGVFCAVVWVGGGWVWWADWRWEALWGGGHRGRACNQKQNGRFHLLARYSPGISADKASPHPTHTIQPVHGGLIGYIIFSTAKAIRFLGDHLVVCTRTLALSGDDH